jgi:DNA polymerase III subunit delta'
MTDGTAAVASLSTKLCPWLRPALEQLEAARATGRLGHGWLLCGPAGVGKINLALVFAARLLKRDPAGPPAELGPAEAAAAVRERHAPADRHPDLHWLFPEEDKRTIAIEQLRAVAEQLSLKAHRGVAKVVVVEPADAMTTAASNALLKTLEEPSADTYLLLPSQQPDRLPATIRSRCQRLEIAPPKPETVRTWLGDADPASFASAWLLAGGAPLSMAAMLESGTLQENNDLSDLLLRISEDKVDPQSAADRWAKGDAELVLTWLTRQLHREIRTRLAPGVSTPVTDPAAPILHNAWAELTLRHLFAQYARAEQLLTQLGSGINLELALHALLLGFQPDRGRS